MPVYDYVCKDCQHSFELILTLSKHDKDNIRCPKCESKKRRAGRGCVLRRDVEEELTKNRRSRRSDRNESRERYRREELP